MGLAASQCRLLFLTSRQNDLSAKMQRISMEKMRLASDEDDAYAEYQRLYNRKVYQNSDGTDLSYNEIMGASAANMGYTNWITDASGRVVLSDDLASKFGLSDAEGLPRNFTDKYGSKEDFIRAVEPTDAENIIAKLDEIVVPPTGGDILLADLTDTQIAKVKEFKDKYGSYPSISKTMSFKEIINAMGNFSAAGIDETNFNTGFTGNKPSSLGMSFKDIMSSAQDVVILIGDDGDESSVPVEQAIKNLKVLTKNISTAIANAMGIEAEPLCDAANEWYRKTCGSLNYYDNTASSMGAASDKAIANARNGLVGFGCDDTGDTDHDIITVNLTELVKRLLMLAERYYEGGNTTYFGDYSTYNNGYKVNGYDENTSVDCQVNEKGYSICRYESLLKSYANLDSVSDKVKTYLGKSGDELPPLDQDTIYKNKAAYYKNMYEKLSTLGWVRQSMDTIQKNLNQGLYYINNEKISNSDKYNEVADEEAKEQAKTWYDNELRKIKRKEDQWDTQLNRTQTEYTSITNDYNSVKSIIDANIQKSFTYCSNG